MNQETFLIKLTELAEKFETSNDNKVIGLFFVSPTEEVFRWDGFAFKSSGFVKVRLRKKKPSIRENTQGLSSEKRLELIDRDLSIISHFLSKYEYLRSKTKERVAKFLPLFKPEYLADTKIRLHVDDLSIQQLLLLTRQGSYYWHTVSNNSARLEHLLGRLLEKRNNTLYKITRGKTNDSNS